VQVRRCPATVSGARCHKPGLIPLDELLALVRAKPAELHLMLTGRNAPAELIELADQVSEIQPIKHPLQMGIKAQRGIEF
jgi:cob(I)alamin adenosyltransferase